MNKSECSNKTQRTSNVKIKFWVER